MDIVLHMGQYKECAARPVPWRNSNAKLVVFANVPEDNPFMAGAFHGAGGRSNDKCRISGPGVVRSVVERFQI